MADVLIILDNNSANKKLENNFKCLICKTFTTGSVSFKEHLTGSKHQKKLNSITSLEPNHSIETSEDIDVGVPFPFTCETCNKKFTGKMPYEQHLYGAEHSRKVNTKPHTDKSLYNAFPFINKKPLDIALQEPIEDPYPFGCKTCDKTSNGKDPCENHLFSALRSWKAITKTPNEDEASMASKESSEDVLTGDSDLLFPFSCLVCDKRFTGEKPYQQHLESTVHARKVNLDPNEVFACSKCQMIFSGPIPHKQHLESLKHEIMIAGPGKASVLKVKRQLEIFKGGYRPEDIRCYRVDEPFGEEMVSFTWICDEAQEVADNEFLASLGT